MKTKPFLVPLLGAAAVLTVALALPTPSSGQAGNDDAVLTALVTEIVKQNDLIAANQTKIDEQLAAVAENVRLARIYVGRGGGKAGGDK